MSAPSLDQNHQSSSLRVPTVSPETAFFCLDRVCPPDAMRAPRRRVEAVRAIEDGVLPVDRLIEMARKRGVYLRPAQFEWRSLLIAASTNAVLLLLENGNVIAVLGTGREGVEEIIVSDPLYQNGEPFFLPRVALEHAWRGDALIVKTRRSGANRALTWYISILSLCGLTAGLLLLLRVALDVTITGSAAQSDSAAMSASRSHAGDRTANMQQPAVSLGKTAEVDTTAQAIPASMSVITPNSSVSPEGKPAALVPQERRAEPPASDVAESKSKEPGAASGANVLASAVIDESAGQLAALGGLTRAEQASASAAAMSPIVAPAAATANSGFSAERAAALIAQGDALIMRGDVVSARWLFARAVALNDGQAALRLGKSFDSAFLARAHLYEVRGDASLATRWYKRARDLGVSEAYALLQAIARRQALSELRWRPPRVPYYWDWNQ